MIVHDVTGQLLRFILGGVVDAHARGEISPESTPELWAYVPEILAWCSSPGDETRDPENSLWLSR